jgi:hypothetical protein
MDPLVKPVAIPGQANNVCVKGGYFQKPCIWGLFSCKAIKIEVG